MRYLSSSSDDGMSTKHTVRDEVLLPVSGTFFAIEPRRVVRQDLGVPVLEVRGIAPVVHCDRLISLGLARVGLILFRHSVETGGVPVRRGE